MRRPGSRLHRAAARFLDPSTVARFVRPAVADMHWEFDQADSDAGRRLARRRGYASLIRLLPFLLLQEASLQAAAFFRDDGHALARVLGATAAAVAILTALSIMPAYRGMPGIGRAVAPAALALLVPRG